MAKSRRRHDENPDTKLSKSLSYILRHGALKEGLEMDQGGYIAVDDLLHLPKFRDVKLEDVLRIVESNDKQRFSIRRDPDSGAVSIKANQGHTIEVPDLELKEIGQSSDVPVVVHGTYRKAYQLIKDQGLSRMKRNHIHFAAGLPGDHGVISDGFKFYQSANNVILCPGNSDGYLPPEYFAKVEFL